ncbi:MAG: DUF4012 domain-containing protein [Patescibacteria group bacterium]
MDGFQKIDLTPKAGAPSEISSPIEPNKPSRFSRFGRKKILGVVLGVLVFLLITVILPSFLVYASAKKTYASAQATLYLLKQQDIASAANEIDKTRENLKDTQGKMNLLVVLRIIPFVNNYYGDARHILAAGEHFIDAGDIFIESIEPYADLLGLKGQGSFTGGSAEQRIETAVKTMDKVTPKIDEISDKLNLAKEEIDHINPKDYPGKYGDQMEQIVSLMDNGATLVSDARPLIKVMPQLLGEPKEKKYLILFQNDKELRPTGGFLTAYSIFRLDGGVIHVESSNDIYLLDDTVRGKDKAPEPLRSLLKVSVLNIRDVNLSPDFVKSMNDFSDMYENAGGYVNVDGIIAVDTHALVGAMKILGDISVGGKTYTTEPDKRCGGCPQVIYELEDYSSRPVNYVRTERKGLIGDLMYAIMNKAFSSSPKEYWGPLFQEMLGQVAQKHVLFYLENKDAQKGLDTLNASGRIMDFSGDYLHINEANFGGAKSNMFVNQSISQEYDVKPDGTIEKTVTITYKNPFAPSDCNLERGGLCLNADLKDWFRIYVPEGSKLVSMNGQQASEDPYEDLGKTVFEGFLVIRPQGSKVLTVKYILPYKFDKKKGLPLMIQKQPGTEDDEYKIMLGKKEVDKFILNTDKKLTVK